MKGPKTQYTNEMYKKFGYFATWEPNRPLELGDVGILRKNEFTRIFNISRRFDKIKFIELPDETPGDLDYNSEGSVSITLKLAGTIPQIGSVLTEADAGISIEFSSDKSVVFKANETYTPSIDDTIKLGNQIIELYREGKWEKNWVVITEIVKAKSATIIISNKKDGKIELKANANVDIVDIDIANAEFKFSPAFSRGLETRIIAQKGLTPLFKAMSIKSRFILSPIFTTKGLRSIDLLTPEEAKGKMNEKIYFGNVDFEIEEE